MYYYIVLCAINVYIRVESGSCGVHLCLSTMAIEHAVT